MFIILFSLWGHSSNIHRDAGGREAAQVSWSQLVRTLKTGQAYQKTQPRLLTLPPFIRSWGVLQYLSLTTTNPLSFHAHIFGEQICTSHSPCYVGTWPSIYTLLPLCTYLLSTTISFIIVQAYLFTSKMITKFPILIKLASRYLKGYE